MNIVAATLLASDDATLRPAVDPFALAEANINTLTGLSTDYLNHFNEAVMLLELIPSMPECRDDLIGWQPTTYREHFAASHLRHRALAVAAFDLADRFIRRQFDDLCDEMTMVVMTARAALIADASRSVVAATAAQAAAQLKPLMARASALIHGLDISSGKTASIQDSQAAVDALLEP